MGHRLLFISVIFLTVANLLVWSLIGIERAYAKRVYPGVWVDTQPLSGLTREQVVDRLRPIHQAMLLEKVTLRLADKTFEPTLAELGYQVNTNSMADAALQLGRGQNLQEIILELLNYHQTRTIPLVYDIDQGKFDSYLNEIGKGITKDPKDLTLEYKDGKIIVLPPVDGITLDRDELREAIQKQVRPGKTAEITLKYGKKKPAIIEEAQAAPAKTYLEKLLVKPLTIRAEEVNVTLTPSTIYSFVYYEIEGDKLIAAINEDKVREYVGKIAKQVDIDPVTKRVSTVNSTVLEEGRDGRELNVPDATKRIMERLNNADFEAPVILTTSKIERKTVVISPEFQTGRFEGRYIEVDLSAQRMHLIEGDNYHRTYIISTGKWDTPTPIGEFEILNHIGVAYSKPYDLFMPHWMGLKRVNGTYEGYGIHGLPYWRNGKKEGQNHLGRPVSHGCIRLGTDGEAEYVYAWAQNGTKVVIHE